MDWLDESPWWRSLVNYVDLITRTWGVFTSIVLFGVGADLCSLSENHQLAGGFAIAAGFITLFLEMTWAFTIALQVTLRNENHAIYGCWDAVLWLDTWKRSLMYAILAVLLFADPHRPWFVIVSAVMLIVLAILQLVRWYNALSNVPMSLLEQQEYGFDDLEVEIPLPEPVQRPNPFEVAELQSTNQRKDTVLV